ncbi:MAG TPA: hypothetical protein VFS31_09080, partial [Chitinophagaceae bacterium]|nr:hypothetical protein [Chitinophagaceae bacterium]
ELFTGGKDYRDLLLDDKVVAHSFFGVGTNVKIDNYKSHTANVHLVFFVNLSKIASLSALGHRGDEEARQDVYNFLKMEHFGFVIKNLVTGVDRVLEEYPGRDNEMLIKFDMHPWHCFRYNVECTYDPATIL